MSPPTQQTRVDVSQQRIAAVYAKALLGACQTAGNTEQVVQQLESLLDDVLLPNRQFHQFLASDFVSAEDKSGMIERVLAAQASPTLVNFLKVMAAHHRLSALEAVRHAVRDLYNRHRGLVEVTLTTAAPIDEALKSEIVERLRSMLEGEPVLRAEVDDDLLGGAVVRVGDTVYDGSVQSQLQKLRTDMIDRTVEQIETSRHRFLLEGDASTTSG